jgi:hypothetical protein
MGKPQKKPILLQCLPTDKYDNCLPFNMTYEFPQLLERDYGAQAQKRSRRLLVAFAQFSFEQ